MQPSLWPRSGERWTWHLGFSPDPWGGLSHTHTRPIGLKSCYCKGKVILGIRNCFNLFFISSRAPPGVSDLPFLPACRKADIWCDLAPTTHLCRCVSDQRANTTCWSSHVPWATAHRSLDGSRAACVSRLYEWIASNLGAHSICHLQEGNGGSPILAKRKACPSPREHSWKSRLSVYFGYANDLG